MKKSLLLFIAALCATVAVNAKTITLEPGENKIKDAYATAEAGDVIELTGDADHVYTEWSSITIEKPITLRAAEGATPVVHMPKIKMHAAFEVEGIEFYGFTDYLFITEVGGDFSVSFRNCVLRDNPAYFIYLCENQSINSLKIDGCIFKDNTKNENCVVYGRGTISNFEMRNSTVMNCLGNYAVRVYSGENFVVDHCTFANVGMQALRLAEITKTSTAIAVSNCVIFSETATTDYAYYIYNGTLTNSVYFNSPTPGYRSGLTVNKIINANPQFIDPANGNLNFAFTSPLFLAATDGTNIGDPRWGVEEPETAIEVPGTLPVMDAVLQGTKISKSEEGIKWNDNSANPDDNTASWVIDVAKAGIYEVVINETTSSGHKYIVSVADAEGWLGTISESADSWKTGDIILGSLTFEQAGKYLLRLTNGTKNSSSNASKVIVNYAGGAMVDVPGTLPNEDAILGGNAKVKVDEEGYICFSGDGNVPNCFAKWNANFTKKGEFGVSINVATTNGHKYKVQVLKGEAVVGEAEEPSQVETQGEIILKGNIKLQEAGTYTIKLINQTAHSNARVKDITFTYSGGAVVNIPATLLPADAILSEKAFVDNDTIIFAPRGSEDYTPEGWAKWNVHLENDAICQFTANCFRFSGNTMTIKISVYNADNELVYNPEAKSVANSGNSAVDLDSKRLPAGDYVIQMQNTTQYSKGRLMSVEVTAQPIITINDDSDIDFTDYAGQTVTVQLMRTFKANMWNPICLPFGVGHSKLQSILKCETSYLLDNASLENQKLFVQLAASEYNDIYQGVPYMIKPTEGVENPIFENVTIMETPHASAREKGPLTLQGSFESHEIDNPSHVLLVGANNTLFFPSDDAPHIKSMRAYFILQNVEPSLMPRFAAFVEPGNAPTEMIIVGGEAERQKGHRKVLVDGQIRIQHEGKCYSILGLER